MNVPHQIEYCISCGDETPYTIDTHIDFRYGYIKGVGQLCRICFHGTPKETTHLSVPKSIIRDTPNNAELGAKVRHLYHENNS